MIAAVFDCMVFLQAATNERSPASALFDFVESNHIQLYLSPPILAEVRDVLQRSKVQARFPNLTPARADIFVQKLTALAVLVSNVPNAGVPLQDRDDLPYLNLAIAAGTEYLVSRDNGLLKLMEDVSLRKEYPRLQILDPVAFLNVARRSKAA